MKLNSFVALLRGINVGGHKKVPMADLRAALTEAGFHNPRTLLASGNVVFQTELTDRKTIADKITATLQAHFPFDIPVSVYHHAIFEEAVALDPFGQVQLTPQIRFYVTFLSSPYSGEPTLPYKVEDHSFQIISAREEMLFSYLDLDKIKTVDAMTVLDKFFGKQITTRNWNTVVKISAL